MAIDINHCLIEGRLGRDPETRVLGSGSKVVNASIACNDDYKDRSGEWKKRAYWITIAAFGHAGDQLEQFAKGDRIIVTGKWTVDEYTKDSKKVYYNKLAVHDVRGSEIRRDGGQQRQSEGNERPAREPATPARTGPSSAPADFDDEVPF
jgi:single-strand DNA-binding protein